MPTVNEMIKRLEIVRDMYDCGDYPLAISIPGEFSTTLVNVIAPPMKFEFIEKDVVVIVAKRHDQTTPKTHLKPI